MAPRAHEAANATMSAMPRLRSLIAIEPSSLAVEWTDGRTDVVDLGDWIRGGGDLLAPLARPEVFNRARIGEYGASVEWNDPELAIDAVHLARLVGAP